MDRQDILKRAKQSIFKYVNPITIEDSRADVFNSVTPIEAIGIEFIPISAV